jgi:hypothetical protein
MTGHLIHIGHAKAGSTFLKRWFEGHPQIAYDRRGIAGFRDIHALVRHCAEPPPDLRCCVTSSEALATPHVHMGRFRDGRASGEQIRVDPRIQAEACALLAALFPAAYVLLVTRGFRSMILSGYSQYVRTGGEAEFPGRSDKMNAAAAFNYDHLVGLYSRAFGDRLIVLPYELLRDDPVAFVGEVERRLGLSHWPPPRGRYNPALSPAELRWYPRLTRFVRRLPVGARPRRALMRAWLPAVMANRLRPLVALLQFLRPAEPVTDALVTDEMVEYFRGRAEFARTNPLYAPYAEDYLL